MKKLFIANGSRSEIPLIREAKALGYYVITSGNNPDLIGHKYADEYMPCDFSDREALLETFSKSGADAILSACHDLSYISTVYIAEKLGLPGLDDMETTLTIHHKDRFKNMAMNLGVLVPFGRGFSDKSEAIAYCNSIPADCEVMIKPVDLGGGKGITKAKTIEEKIKAIDIAFSASKSQRIVIEEFIDSGNTMNSMSCFIIDETVVFSFVDDGHIDADYPFYAFCSSSMGSVSKETEDFLIKEINTIAHALHLHDGKLHFNFLMNKKDGKPYILEMHRRSSGDMYSDMIYLATGINWANWIVRAQTGMPLGEFPRYRAKVKPVFYYTVYSDNNGIVNGVEYSSELLMHLRNNLSMWHPGLVITNHNTEPLALLHCECDSKDEMDLLIDEIHHGKHINIY